MKMELFLTVLTCILLTISILTLMISKKSNMDREKSSPFECGFSALSKARMPFSIHFFMIGIIFLIFDIEISLLMPISLSLKLIKLNQWMFSSVMILTLMIYSIYHEWINGMLKWSK